MADMTNPKDGCPECGAVVRKEELAQTYKVCPKCNYHYPLSSHERIKQIMDPGTFVEYDAEMESINPLNFPDYFDKIKRYKELTGLKEAVVTGEGIIEGHSAIIGITDYRFLMGSMASVLGEKITICMERGIEKRLPVIIFSSSGGGARMQEGMLSLMQMAKTSAASMKLKQSGLLYINVLSYRSFAGVMASFASLGNIIIAEPNTLIGFTGERGRSSIKQELPDGFQKAEFMIERGMIDMIVERKKMKSVLGELLEFFS